MRKRGQLLQWNVQLYTTDHNGEGRNGKVTSVNVQFLFVPTLGTQIRMARAHAMERHTSKWSRELFSAEGVQLDKGTKPGLVF